jgi:hypothetical protein
MRWGDKLEALTVSTSKPLVKQIMQGVACGASPLDVKILTHRQLLHHLENTP